MRDRKEKKLNKADLDQVRSLLGSATGEGFSLDEILAEYGRGAPKAPPAPASSATPEPPAQPAEPAPAPEGDAPQGNVVAFPGGRAGQEEVPPPDPAGTQPEEPAEAEEAEEGQEVIPFPQEESALSAFLKDIGEKADQYADHMFEEDEATDHAQVRRLERLIPGTDQEEPEEPAPARVRPPRRQEPPPPDTPPQELARRYGKGLKGVRVRSLLVFLLAVLALVQTLVPLLGFYWLPPLDSPALQHWVSVGLLGAGMLLAVDALCAGLFRLFHLQVEMDTLAALSCLATLADGVALALAPAQEERLPYTLVCLVGLFFLLHGTYHSKCGLRLACRTAAATATPYRVTLDEGKWSGRDSYATWSGSCEGFGSQIQTTDGARRVFRRVCPLFLIGGALLTLLVSVGAGHPERLLWALSALLTATAAFGGGLAYSRPFHKLARRLAQSGAALAGWPGTTRARRGDRVLITDTDLFPPGYVELNGYKVMAQFPSERVVAYTATLLRDAGSGLFKVFHDQLRAMGGLMRNAGPLTYHEGGGLSANIRGEQVMVGSAAFMKLMEVPLPQGLNVKNAVFCAIEGELAGIFALNYTLPDVVFPALEELILSKVGPVLATRDFNLIPSMLHQRFKLASDKMDFPPVERRRELSDPDQPHSDTLTALLCREGLLPFAESIVAAKRLWWATRLGAVACCVCSFLGLLLAGYLTSVGAYTALSPLHLLIYLLTWLAPVWLLSDWVHRF